MPLQDDEIAALTNAQQAATSKQKVIVVSSSSPMSSSSPAPVSTLRTVLTTGLRPQQLLLQPMQPPAYRLVTPTSQTSQPGTCPNPGTIIPDNDPSLDENLLNILAAEGEEDDPMMSPSVSVKTLAGLSQSNHSLVLPNTVFSSKPISNQDVGVFLQSSGKSSNNLQEDQINTSIQAKPVLLSASNATPQFVLPRSTSVSGLNVKQCVTHVSSQVSHATSTSSQTLRSLLSSTPENLPVSQTLILSPLSSGTVSSGSHSMVTKTYQTATLVNPPPLTSSSSKLSESFLPADISFSSSNDRSSTAETVTLTLDDIMSYSNVTNGASKERLATPAPSSDRESDLTSPGSVRSELTDTGKSEEGDPGPEKLHCQFPGCNRSFDRPNLLKRHQKIHSGECR